jgi:hypothetical protein
MLLNKVFYLLIFKFISRILITKKFFFKLNKLINIFLNIKIVTKKISIRFDNYILGIELI